MKVSVTTNGKTHVFMSLEYVRFWASRDLDDTENPYFCELIEAARILLELLKPACAK